MQREHTNVCQNTRVLQLNRIRRSCMYFTGGARQVVVLWQIVVIVLCFRGFEEGCGVGSLQLILNYFAERKRAVLEDAHREFKRIIAQLENIYNVRPFNQQTAQSLTELFALVLAVHPATILELGAGSRSSTIALALAAATFPLPPRIISIDINPGDFTRFAKTHFPHLRLAPVEDVCAEATEFRIPPSCAEPVFMLYDAHDEDVPGIKIFPFARQVWFPEMPGAVVAVHDCSVFPQPQEGLASYYHQAVFSPEVTLVGFGEVPGLVQYLQENELTLGLPGREMQALQIDGEGTSLIYFQLPARS
jgi:hypothetical protein